MIINTSGYRFDTTLQQFSAGQHDFAADLRAAADGSRDAEVRALNFINQRFAVASANVPGGVGGQQSAVSVEQRDYSDFPLWQAARKGEISNGMPFPIPVLAPASGAAGAHTEGIEPAPTFTGAKQTITPKPISGKVEITREAWDLTGPDASSLVWGRMVAAYNEALEAGVATVLTAAAASITDIVLTTAAVDVALVDQLLDAIAAFSFIPGGAKNARAVLQLDLYRALARAKDSTGRKLLAGRGPANTADQGSQSLDLQGIPGLPGWGLGATSTASSNSWLIDPRAVQGWATPPLRFDFQYRVAFVDVAIWGYQGVAVTDTTGLRQVTYDPIA